MRLRFSSPLFGAFSSALLAVGFGANWWLADRTAADNKWVAEIGLRSLDGLFKALDCPLEYVAVGTFDFPVLEDISRDSDNSGREHSTVIGRFGEGLCSCGRVLCEPSDDVGSAPSSASQIFNGDVQKAQGFYSEVRPTEYTHCVFEDLESALDYSRIIPAARARNAHIPYGCSTSHSKRAWE